MENKNLMEYFTVISKSYGKYYTHKYIYHSLEELKEEVKLGLWPIECTEWWFVGEHNVFKWGR